MQLTNIIHQTFISMKKNRSERRMKALLRLEAQIEAGKKSNKGKTYPLTDKDTKRINKEIGSLTKTLKGVETNV